MSEISTLKFPVKSITRAKIFYEEFLQTKIMIKEDSSSKVATMERIDALNNVCYLQEEKNLFLPDTFLMIHEYQYYTDIKNQLNQVLLLGGEVLFLQQNETVPVNYQALIKDSEGNRIIILFNNKDVSNDIPSAA